MRTVRLVCALCMLLLSLSVPVYALAQDGDTEQPAADNVTPAQEQDELSPEIISAPEEEEPAVTEQVVLRPNFPTVEGIAGGDFQYEIECLYVGLEASKTFDLRVTSPQGWEVYMTPRYEKDKKISSINLKPSFSTGETIILYATAPFWPLPDPGDYKINIEAVSDTLKTSVELTARVTSKYFLQTIPANEQYNTMAKAGQDNIFSINVQSLSTDVIDNIQFTSDKPDGWQIDFQPDKIDTLEAFDETTVDVAIKPPPKTVAGDYMIKLRASGKQVTADEISVRVTVETPTIWGWVGVAIIFVVVVGLVGVFMRFSRR